MSGASVSDVNDRLSALELRVQQQEDELTVMKAALADVLRRLAASEVSTAASTKKQAGGKGNVGDFPMAECDVVLLAVSRHTSAKVNVLDCDLAIGTRATGAWVPRVPPMMNGLHSSITLDSPSAVTSSPVCCPLQVELPSVRPSPCPASPTEERQAARESPPR